MYLPKTNSGIEHYTKEGNHDTWRNLLENAVTAQLDHRTLAEFTALATAGLRTYSRCLPFT
jgi:hypothetical protein